jgi:hypothetical protein
MEESRNALPKRCCGLIDTPPQDETRGCISGESETPKACHNVAEAAGWTQPEAEAHSPDPSPDGFSGQSRARNPGNQVAIMSSLFVPHFYLCRWRSPSKSRSEKMHRWNASEAGVAQPSAVFCL